MGKINNYYGQIDGTINYEVVEKLLKKNSSWKYIWISPCQIADKYKDFCGFLSLENLDSVRKSINSITEENGYIAELKIFSENATLYILSFGNSENTRWSCWLRNEAKFDDFSIFPLSKESSSFDKALVVNKSVLLRGNSKENLNKVKRGLGKASINSSNLEFDCYYIEGNLKCWFIGGKK